MLKKIFYLLLIIIFGTNVYAANINNADLYSIVMQRGKIIVGISFDSKPFGFKDTTGDIKGFEADLAREIAGRLLGNKNNVVFKEVESQDRINTVTSGSVDMIIATMTINSERKKFVYFSIPYFIAGQAICVRKDSKIDSIYDLMNKKIILELGTTEEKNIKRFVPTVLIQAYANNSTAVDAFKSGAGDAITTDDVLLEGFVMDNPKYMILPIRLTKEPYGIAFNKSKQTKSLRNHINKIIFDMEMDGTLNTIKNKWVVQ